MTPVPYLTLPVALRPLQACPYGVGSPSMPCCIGPTCFPIFLQPHLDLQLRAPSLPRVPGTSESPLLLCAEPVLPPSLFPPQRVRPTEPVEVRRQAPPLQPMR